MKKCKHWPLFPRIKDFNIKSKAVKLLEGVDFEGIVFDLCRNAAYSVQVVTAWLNIWNFSSENCTHYFMLSF